ncbi:MAG: UDP-N-acetylglucosamine 2-epimerase, partial [Flavobacterium sp.]|nr:UDP-N-acetylglucosamine 2-epimerase [Flavobacterium sp.]
KFYGIDFSKKIILVTCHRRENFGKPFEEICQAILAIAKQKEESVEVVYPVHLNPNIKEYAHKWLIAPNIKLISPLDYPELIWMMNKSNLILTDSGGIQEEAPTLGKPVLVLRKVTERTEGVDAGTALLVGSSYDKICSETLKLLDDQIYYEKIASTSNPYGDGTTSNQIRRILQSFT